jgi:peptidoglycan/LPS O-acetylase OafA/YrhL
MIKYVEHDRVIGAWSSFLLVLAGSTLAAALSLRLFERPVQDWLRTRYISPSIAAQ